jgi:hypothetical protein
VADLFEYEASLLARANADTTGYLKLATVDLYQTDVDIGSGNTVADFTASVATYVGYAQGVLAWDAASVADDGTVECVSAAITFRPTDATTPNVIYGCFIRGATGGTLLFAGRFDGAPLDMSDAVHQIVLTVRYRPDATSIAVTVS